MADHMLASVFFPIKHLGRIHVSVVLCDQIRLFYIGSDLFLWFTTGIGTTVDKIVVGVNVFQKMTLFHSTDTAGLSRIIQGMCRGIGSLVKSIIVLRLVDAHAPKDNGRMIAILHDHVFDIFHCLILPSLTTDMLPARHFRKD